MRLPNAVHDTRPWRLHEIVPDFTLEDVWALPIEGAAGDFEAVVEHIAAFDPTKADSLAARVLWLARDLLGRWLDLGRISGPAEAGSEDTLPIPGTHETTLLGRVPEDLQATAADLDLGRVPFTPLYRTDDEFAAEISNRTVHGVLHLGWANRGEGRFRAEMAIYVKPRGLLGQGYMALIKPFRHLIVYPALMRQIEKEWRSRAPA